MPSAATKKNKNKMKVNNNNNTEKAEKTVTTTTTTSGRNRQKKKKAQQQSEEKVVSPSSAESGVGTSASSTSNLSSSRSSSMAEEEMNLIRAHLASHIQHDLENAAGETVGIVGICQCAASIPSNLVEELVNDLVTCDLALTHDCDDEETDVEGDGGQDDSAPEKKKPSVSSATLKNAKAQLLLQRSKNFNKLLDTQKDIRTQVSCLYGSENLHNMMLTIDDITITAQQLVILRKANALNSMFVKSMEAIMHLGHCPSLLQDRTDAVSHGLIKVHKSIHTWDEKLELLVSQSKGRKTILSKVFKSFYEKFGREAESLTDAEFQMLCEELEDAPEFPGGTKFSDLLKELDMAEVIFQWEEFRHGVELKLIEFEKEFREISFQYGIRPPNPLGLCPSKPKHLNSPAANK